MIPKLLIGAVAAATMSVPFAGVAWADVSVSVGGFTVADDGGPSTAVTLGPNLAIAYNNSEAGATRGIGNVAIAGNNSYTSVSGLLSTANADNDSTADAAGIGNTAIARNGSSAEAFDGNFNTVQATNNSHAGVYVGNFNTLSATDGSTAFVTGDANRITARCGGSVTLEAQGQTVTTPCETG
jgi:hypothetical protein